DARYDGREHLLRSVRLNEPAQPLHANKDGRGAHSEQLRRLLAASQPGARLLLRASRMGTLTDSGRCLLAEQARIPGDDRKRRFASGLLQPEFGVVGIRSL